ncbi:MAG: flagellar FlbD family protein [Kineosporiaceae bacterium]|nr:flagellar FlbD family protein [Kineosporiaceae bacterium]
MAVNPDLIERAESTPDTVLTMIDGHKIVVVESLAETVELIRTWRATVVAQAYSIGRAQDATGAIGRHPSLFVSREGVDHRHPSRRGRPEESDLGETDPEETLGEHAALNASLARVLRLPQRGE